MNNSGSAVWCVCVCMFLYVCVTQNNKMLWYLAYIQTYSCRVNIIISCLVYIHQTNYNTTFEHKPNYYSSLLLYIHLQTVSFTMIRTKYGFHYKS